MAKGQRFSMDPVEKGDYVHILFMGENKTEEYKGIVSHVYHGGHQFVLDGARFEIIDPRITKLKIAA
jgi:hypothetical protein